MKKPFSIQYSIIGKSSYSEGRVSCFTEKVNAEDLAAKVIDHRAKKIHILAIYYHLNEKQFITIYKEGA